SPNPLATSTIFNEGGSAVTVASNITINTAGSATMSSATVTITTNFLDGSAEVLDLPDASRPALISKSYTAPMLTLSGNDSLAHYQAALRAVTYNNTSQTPNALLDALTKLNRTVAFTVVDSNNNSSLPDNATVPVQPVNDAPVIALKDPALDLKITVDEVQDP